MTQRRTSLAPRWGEARPRRVYAVALTTLCVVAPLLGALPRAASAAPVAPLVGYSAAVPASPATGGERSSLTGMGSLGSEPLTGPASGGPPTLETSITAACLQSQTTPWATFSSQVSVACGNLAIAQLDLTVPSVGFPATIARWYDSNRASSDGPFGYGWSWTYGLRVTAVAGGADVARADGRVDHFTTSGSGYISPPGIHDALGSVGGGGWQLTLANQIVDTFTSTGLLASVADPNGNALSIGYSGGTISTITDTAGRTWLFTTVGGRVTKVTDPGGRAVSYAYSGAGDLIGVTDPTGAVTAYGYASHVLVSRTDGKGHATTSEPPWVSWRLG